MKDLIEKRDRVLCTVTSPYTKLTRKVSDTILYKRKYKDSIDSNDFNDFSPFNDIHEEEVPEKEIDCSKTHSLMLFKSDYYNDMLTPINSRPQSWSPPANINIQSRLRSTSGLDTIYQSTSGLDTIYQTIDTNSSWRSQAKDFIEPSNRFDFLLSLKVAHGFDTDDFEEGPSVVLRGQGSSYLVPSIIEKVVLECGGMSPDWFPEMSTSYHDQSHNEDCKEGRCPCKGKGKGKGGTKSNNVINQIADIIVSSVVEDSVQRYSSLQLYDVQNFLTQSEELAEKKDEYKRKEVANQIVHNILARSQNDNLNEIIYDKSNHVLTNENQYATERERYKEKTKITEKGYKKERKPSYDERLVANSIVYNTLARSSLKISESESLEKHLEIKRVSTNESQDVNESEQLSANSLISILRLNDQSGYEKERKQEHQKMEKPLTYDQIIKNQSTSESYKKSSEIPEKEYKKERKGDRESYQKGNRESYQKGIEKDYKKENKKGKKPSFDEQIVSNSIVYNILARSSLMIRQSEKSKKENHKRDSASTNEYKDTSKSSLLSYKESVTTSEKEFDRDRKPSFQRENKSLDSNLTESRKNLQEIRRRGSIDKSGKCSSSIEHDANLLLNESNDGDDYAKNQTKRKRSTAIDNDDNENEGNAVEQASEFLLSLGNTQDASMINDGTDEEVSCDTEEDIAFVEENGNACLSDGNAYHCDKEEGKPSLRKQRVANKLKTGPSSVIELCPIFDNLTKSRNRNFNKGEIEITIDDCEQKQENEHEGPIRNNANMMQNESESKCESESESNDKSQPSREEGLASSSNRVIKAIAGFVLPFIGRSPCKKTLPKQTLEQVLLKHILPPDECRSMRSSDETAKTFGEQQKVEMDEGKSDNMLNPEYYVDTDTITSSVIKDITGFVSSFIGGGQVKHIPLKQTLSKQTLHKQVLLKQAFSSDESEIQVTSTNVNSGKSTSVESSKSTIVDSNKSDTSIFSNEDLFPIYDCSDISSIQSVNDTSGLFNVSSAEEIINKKYLSGGGDINAIKGLYKIYYGSEATTTDSSCSLESLKDDFYVSTEDLRQDSLQGDITLSFKECYSLEESLSETVLVMDQMLTYIENMDSRATRFEKLNAQNLSSKIDGKIAISYDAQSALFKEEDDTEMTQNSDFLESDTDPLFIDSMSLGNYDPGKDDKFNAETDMNVDMKVDANIDVKVNSIIDANVYAESVINPGGQDSIISELETSYNTPELDSDLTSIKSEVISSIEVMNETVGDTKREPRKLPNNNNEFIEGHRNLDQVIHTVNNDKALDVKIKVQWMEEAEIDIELNVKKTMGSMLNGVEMQNKAFDIEKDVNKLMNSMLDELERKDSLLDTQIDIAKVMDTNIDEVERKDSTFDIKIDVQTVMDTILDEIDRKNSALDIKIDVKRVMDTMLDVIERKDSALDIPVDVQRLMISMLDKDKKKDNKPRSKRLANLLKDNKVSGHNLKHKPITQRLANLLKDNKVSGDNLKHKLMITQRLANLFKDDKVSIHNVKHKQRTLDAILDAILDDVEYDNKEKVTPSLDNLLKEYEISNHNFENCPNDNDFSQTMTQNVAECYKHHQVIIQGLEDATNQEHKVDKEVCNVLNEIVDEVERFGQEEGQYDNEVGQVIAHEVGRCDKDVAQYFKEGEEFISQYDIFHMQQLSIFTKTVFEQIEYYVFVVLNEMLDKIEALNISTISSFPDDCESKAEHQESKRCDGVTNLIIDIETPAKKIDQNSQICVNKLSDPVSKVSDFDGKLFYSEIFHSEEALLDIYSSDQYSKDVLVDSETDLSKDAYNHMFDEILTSITDIVNAEVALVKKIKAADSDATIISLESNTLSKSSSETELCSTLMEAAVLKMSEKDRSLLLNKFNSRPKAQDLTDDITIFPDDITVFPYDIKAAVFGVSEYSTISLETETDPTSSFIEALLSQKSAENQCMPGDDFHSRNRISKYSFAVSYPNTISRCLNSSTFKGSHKTITPIKSTRNPAKPPMNHIKSKAATAGKNPRSTILPKTRSISAPPIKSIFNDLVCMSAKVEKELQMCSEKSPPAEIKCCRNSQTIEHFSTLTKMSKQKPSQFKKPSLKWNTQFRINSLPAKCVKNHAEEISPTAGVKCPIFPKRKALGNCSKNALKSARKTSPLHKSCDHSTEIESKSQISLFVPLSQRLMSKTEVTPPKSCSPKHTVHGKFTKTALEARKSPSPNFNFCQKSSKKESKGNSPEHRNGGKLHKTDVKSSRSPSPTQKLLRKTIKTQSKSKIIPSPKCNSKSPSVPPKKKLGKKSPKTVSKSTNPNIRALPPKSPNQKRKTCTIGKETHSDVILGMLEEISQLKSKPEFKTKPLSSPLVECSLESEAKTPICNIQYPSVTPEDSILETETKSSMKTQSQLKSPVYSGQELEKTLSVETESQTLSPDDCYQELERASKFKTQSQLISQDDSSMESESKIIQPLPISPDDSSLQMTTESSKNLSKIIQSLPLLSLGCISGLDTQLSKIIQSLSRTPYDSSLELTTESSKTHSLPISTADSYDFNLELESSKKIHSLPISTADSSQDSETDTSEFNTLMIEVLRSEELKRYQTLEEKSALVKTLLFEKYDNHIRCPTKVVNYIQAFEKELVPPKCVKTQSPKSEWLLPPKCVKTPSPKSEWLLPPKCMGSPPKYRKKLFKENWPKTEPPINMCEIKSRPKLRASECIKSLPPKFVKNAHNQSLNHLEPDREPTKLETQSRPMALPPKYMKDKSGEQSLESEAPRTKWDIKFQHLSGPSKWVVFEQKNCKLSQVHDLRPELETECPKFHNQSLPMPPVSRQELELESNMLEARSEPVQPPQKLMHSPSTKTARSPAPKSLKNVRSPSPKCLKDVRSPSPKCLKNDSSGRFTKTDSPRSTLEIKSLRHQRQSPSPQHLNSELMEKSPIVPQVNFSEDSETEPYKLNIQSQTIPSSVDSFEVMKKASQLVEPSFKSILPPPQSLKEKFPETESQRKSLKFQMRPISPVPQSISPKFAASNLKGRSYKQKVITPKILLPKRRSTGNSPKTTVLKPISPNRRSISETKITVIPKQPKRSNSEKRFSKRSPQNGGPKPDVNFCVYDTTNYGFVTTFSVLRQPARPVLGNLFTSLCKNACKNKIPRT